MTIAAYPFASAGDFEHNLEQMEEGIEKAARAGARLLVFHECALCGYPPIETDITNVTERAVCSGLNRLSVLAEKYKLYLLVGTVSFHGGSGNTGAAAGADESSRFNSAVLIDPAGVQTVCYDKQALWGWDLDNFSRGQRPGIIEVDGFKIGVRICFDVRFPELFRPLYLEGVDACAVLFSDTQPEPSPGRFGIIQAHLITRAVECLAPLISVNSLSRVPTAPTAVFDRRGGLAAQLDQGGDGLLTYELERQPLSFGEEGMRVNNEYFASGKAR